MPLFPFDVVLTNTYDALGDRLTQSATIAGTADFLNSYAYNADQQLTMVQQQQQTGGNTVSPKEIDYSYNALGQVTSTADYNFIGVGPRIDVLTGAYSYDNGARLTGIAYTSNAGATTIDTLGWGYEPANNVTSFTSIDGTATYGYDPTNQLTSATYSTASGGHQPTNESFSFDLNGNRNSTGYATGSDNLMTSDGTFNYQHDVDGNSTVRTRISNAYATDYQTVYTWDYRNRLTDVEYYDNNCVLTKHVHYVYDVLDHLIATEVDPNGGGQYTSIQHYVLDVSPEIPAAGEPGTALAQPVLVFDGSGSLIGRNLVAPDPAGVDAVMVQGMVVSTSQGDTDVFAVDDNLGTPRDLVDSTGTLARHDVFTAFGQDIYSSDLSLTYWAGFGGGHEDAITGLVNDYERWYNPATGTWLTPDPSGFSTGDPNLERYAGNSPTNAIDPSGLYQQPPEGYSINNGSVMGDVSENTSTGQTISTTTPIGPQMIFGPGYFFNNYGYDPYTVPVPSPIPTIVVNQAAYCAAQQQEIQAQIQATKAQMVAAQAEMDKYAKEAIEYNVKLAVDIMKEEQWKAKAWLIYEMNYGQLYGAQMQSQFEKHAAELLHKTLANQIKQLQKQLEQQQQQWDDIEQVKMEYLESLRKNGPPMP